MAGADAGTTKVEPADAKLLTPLASVKGVRPALADALARLGVVTVADLVRHVPMRYEKLEAESRIVDLKPGTMVTARGEITATRVVRTGKRPRLECVLMDATGRLDLVFFNQIWMKDKLHPGVRVRVQGKSKSFGYGLQVANPNVEIIKDEAEAETVELGVRVRPVYPASEHISSQQIHSVARIVIPAAVGQIPEHLSDEFRKARSLPSLADAYRMAHLPETVEQGGEARRRLAYDELLLLQLGVFLRRSQQRLSVRAPVLGWSEQIDAKIRARFGFPLTRAQSRVIRELVVDLTCASGDGDVPANRLIQGDVGSGKTVVALYAMLLAVAGGKGGGHQAALMAPTELLAEQHFLSISRMLAGSEVRVELITAGVSGAERESLLSRLASGEIDILIGTHALLTETVRFSSLAVAVIDEQHRFGVHQRATLRSKGSGGATAEHRDSATARQPEKLFVPPLAGERAEIRSDDPRPLAPHVIVMTATPIPRTLALTLLGDLDVSVIDELPPGRSPIVTRVVPPTLSGEVYAYVRKRIDAGEQAYVVVPAIDTGASSAGGGGAGGKGGDAELNDLRTVMARLEAHELSGKRLAALHGRLKRETREAVMQRFRAGQVDALVATTVIEVGVDVPNATIMVVEHAERFGLAQLHQLRGRVGRGSKKSVCVLIGEEPQTSTPDAIARLDVMARTTDGFELAEKDLEIRGPGEVFGLRQAGAPPFRVADLMIDRDLLALARKDAKDWVAASPRLDKPEEKTLRTRLLKAHGQWLGLGDVA
jgi:ATP-dependent DNA helicase RecG